MRGENKKKKKTNDPDYQLYTTTIIPMSFLTLPYGELSDGVVIKSREGVSGLQTALMSGHGNIRGADQIFGDFMFPDGLTVMNVNLVQSLSATDQNDVGIRGIQHEARQVITTTLQVISPKGRPRFQIGRASCRERV